MESLMPADVAGRAGRRRRARRIAIVPVALATGLTMAACGGGGSSSSGSSSPSTQPGLTADQWATQVCGALGNWEKALTTTPPDTSNAPSPEEAKTTLTNYMNNLVTSTNTMVSGLQAAGAPAVSNGQAISQGFVGGFQGFQATFVQAQNQANALSTADPAAFNTGAQALAATLRGVSTVANQAKTNLDNLGQKYSSSQLDQAFNNAAACKSVK
jgi:hypothetical protein